MTMPPLLAPGTNPAIRVGQTELQLNKGNHLRLRAAQSVRLSAVRGLAWITVEEDAGEAVVRPGDAFVVSPGKTALVGPLHESVTLELGIAPNAPKRVAGEFGKMRQRLAQLLDRNW